MKGRKVGREILASREAVLYMCSQAIGIVNRHLCPSVVSSAHRYPLSSFHIHHHDTCRHYASRRYGNRRYASRRYEMKSKANRRM